jgi:hypothetical protein
MRTINNVFHLAVGKKDVTRTANVQVLDDSNATTYLAEGEVVVTSVGGLVLNTTTVEDHDKIVIWQGTAGDPIKSPVIERAKTSLYRGDVFEPAASQITYFGFNGTDGEIDVIDEKDYLLRYLHRQSTKTFGSKHFLKFANYTSSATATQADIAEGLVKSFISNLATEPDKFAIAERVNSGAKTALGTSVGPVVFTKGSNVITAADIDDATGAGTALVAGVYIVVGSAANSPVYKITSVDSASDTATLDIPFQGDSGSFADTDLRQIVAASVADFGIKVTGQELKFKVGEFKYDEVRFELTADAGSTPVRTAQEAARGNGYWKVMKELEWEQIGNRGEGYRNPGIGNPSIQFNLNVAQGVRYSTINIHHEHKAGTDVTGLPASSFIQLLIAAPLDNSGDLTTVFKTGTNSVILVLNKFYEDLFPGITPADLEV